jgi:hypothetical protein
VEPWHYNNRGQWLGLLDCKSTYRMGVRKGWLETNLPSQGLAAASVNVTPNVLGLEPSKGLDERFV